MMGDKELQNL